MCITICGVGNRQEFLSPLCRFTRHLQTLGKEEALLRVSVTRQTALLGPTKGNLSLKTIFEAVAASQIQSFNIFVCTLEIYMTKAHTAWWFRNFLMPS